VTTCPGVGFAHQPHVQIQTPKRRWKDGKQHARRPLGKEQDEGDGGDDQADDSGVTGRYSTRAGEDRLADDLDLDVRLLAFDNPRYADRLCRVNQPS
jgi:hypothetical protein